MNYADIIMQFFFEAVPAVPVPAEVRFEAVAAAVLGGKQRRYGPQLKPEAQVVVRKVIQDALDRDEPLHFFVPWASVKQQAGQPLDLLEFSALKQLMCLASELDRYSVRHQITFRIDDLSDDWLFGSERSVQIDRYRSTLRKLIGVMLPTARAVLESQLTSAARFDDAATEAAPVFYKYLRGEIGVDRLAEIGWKGEIPQVQRDYYYGAYQVFYPGVEKEWQLARYFAGTLARVKLQATAAPDKPYVQIAFYPPVPGSPTANSRVYYRTVPERFAHTHRPPWNARGYFQVHEDNRCVPKIAGYEEQLELTPHTVTWAGVEIDAPYLLV